jgi:hypothetical protein
MGSNFSLLHGKICHIREDIAFSGLDSQRVVSLALQQQMRFQSYVVRDLIL